MSMYHLSLKTISRGDGKNALASAAYRSGEKLTDELTDTTFDYTRKQNIDGNFILAPEGASEWTKNRSELWNAVEKSETNKNGSLKKNARLSYEIELSLQQELSPEENMQMTKRFLEENFTSRGFVVDVNFHNLKDNENPHAHCMLTTRELTEDGFGKKIDRDTIKKREFLENTIRPSWEQHINETFEANNVDERVTCKSFKKLGITDKRPEKYLGPKVLGMSARGIDTDRMKEFREDKLYNQIVKKEKEVKVKMEKIKQAKTVKAPVSPAPTAQNASNKPKTTTGISKPTKQEKMNLDPLESVETGAAFKDKFMAFESAIDGLGRQRRSLITSVERIDARLRDENALKGTLERLERDLVNLKTRNPKLGANVFKFLNNKDAEQKKALEDQIEKAKRSYDNFLKEKPGLINQKKDANRSIAEFDSQMKELSDKQRKFVADSKPSNSKSKKKARNKGFEKD